MGCQEPAVFGALLRAFTAAEYAPGAVDENGAAFCATTWSWCRISSTASPPPPRSPRMTATGWCPVLPLEAEDELVRYDASAAAITRTTSVVATAAPRPKRSM